MHHPAAVSAMSRSGTRRQPRDSWDFDGMRKKVLTTLTASHISSYNTARSKPRTSDRSRDSVSELIPEEELKQFMLSESAMRNPIMGVMIRRRDLLMSILSTVLLFGSIGLFACVQVVQPVGYNRRIPDRFYTKEYMDNNSLQRNCLGAYIVTLLGYIIAFNLSVRWKLDIDAELELERLSKAELVRFGPGAEPGTN